jgi:hypothetical protein
MNSNSLTDPPTELDRGGTDRGATAATFPPTGSSSSPTTSEDSDPRLAKDTLFDLLKNQRRRDALTYLVANDGRTTLSDMAEHIAAKENDLPVESINSKQRKRVYIGLYQCHLPKLSDAGVVDFDKDRGTIELCDLATQLYPYIDAVDVGDTDDETPDVLGRGVVDGVRVRSSLLAVLGTAALAGVAGVPGVALLSPRLWAAVCACTLLLVGGYSLLRT